MRSLSARFTGKLSSSSFKPGQFASVSWKSFSRGFAAKSKTIKLDLKPCDLYELEEGPSSTAETTPEELKAHYTTMQTKRRMEIAADGLYKKKMIRGFLHLYNGQEAVSTGMEASLNKDDSIITAYRCHTISLGRGIPMDQIFAELLGKATGCSGGKGGSMHMYNGETHYYGGNGIVGAQVPLGAGVAFAQKYLKKPNATFALYGDGASNQGQVFEAYNMASLWKLPCVFVCENNHYGMGTSAKRSSALTEYYKRGQYIPGIRVDAMNVFSVQNAVAFAKEYAINKGPLVMEMETYRYVGHSMSDPGTTYRTRDDIDKVRKSRDPITTVKNLLLEHSVATEAEIKALDKEIRAGVDKALKTALDAPEPPMEEMWKDIYVEDTPVRGVELSNSYKFPNF